MNYSEIYVLLFIALEKCKAIDSVCLCNGNDFFIEYRGKKYQLLVNEMVYW